MDLSSAPRLAPSFINCSEFFLNEDKEFNQSLKNRRPKNEDDVEHYEKKPHYQKISEINSTTSTSDD